MERSSKKSPGMSLAVSLGKFASSKVSCLLGQVMDVLHTPADSVQYFAALKCPLDIDKSVC